MKKRTIAIGVAAAAYLALDLTLIGGLWPTLGGDVSTETEQTSETEETTTDETAEDEASNEETTQAREFPITENGYEYGTGSQTELYVISEDVALKDTDTEDILERYALPSLERMEATDAEEKMSDLQALKRVEALGVDVAEILTPEYGWKAVYNDSLVSVQEALDFTETIDFEGTTASELNTFLAEHSDVQIRIVSETLTLDETIRVPSNVILDGDGVTVTGGEGEVPAYAFLIENASNIGIYNFHLNGGFDEGIYIITSDHVLLWNNEIEEAVYKAICVMGENSYINLVRNSVHDNGNGAIFFDGNISNCILQGNSVYQNRGTRNLTAGIVFSSMTVEDVYTPYNPWVDEHIYEQLDAPHNCVLKDNLIQGNYSSGFYCDGGYLNYVLDNTIEENEKEGMCLDYGTFGTYVCGNTIRANGHRNRQTDEDLEADFILEWGRMKDGSSQAKLPGLSIDNSSYNIVYNNNISENSGSGVKLVRSGYRNIVLSNVIADNNRGVNDIFHGFGVELGYAAEPDEPVVGLDFTPDYENIIARNVITGAHYAGIHLAVDTYCNDLIDNVIQDAGYAVENASAYYNSAVGNISSVECLNFTLN